jgi:HK97 family phage major capsid protein
VNVGAILRTNIGERMGEELDRVVATGDGVNEPEGIFTSAGIPTMPSVSGTAGPVSIADAENLIFGSPKPYRASNFAPSFVGNDTTYARLRTIRTAAGFNTNAAGPDHQDYRIGGYPYRVAQSAANELAAFGSLRKGYRMYRRAGATIETTDEGSYLRRRNLALLTLRGRFGGRVVQPAAFAKITTLQS